MSATIHLNVQINESNVISSLEEIQKKANEISEKPVKVKVDTIALRDAKAAVNEYYAALKRLSTTNNDISLTSKGFESLSGKWKSLASELNATKTALDLVTNAMKNMPAEHQTQIIDLLNKKQREYNLSIEEQANKQQAASAKISQAAAKEVADRLNAERQKQLEIAKTNELLIQQARESQWASFGNDIDADILRREWEGKQFAENLRAQMEAEARATEEANNLADATDKSAKSFGSYSEKVKEASTWNKLMGDSFGNIVAKMAIWQVMGNVIATVIRSIKEAVNTIKDVDAQLINIQKVTDFDDSRIAAIGESAYSTASKYGITATDYLESVSSFAKAGYDNIEQLAELATMTQRVGDVTAETANKFLIAGDAAFGFGGDVDKLTALLDAANSVENNYATSIEKIAQGFPIVASTAANANMTFAETIAALGTITSVTQETGTKAATALRALILNVEGEVGEFLDESGETIEVTEEGVKSITDALKIYGNESIQAAMKSGKIIDPMEALASLAQAYEDGLLNDIELQNILMNVGGKLRTNQLTALIKHWDLYESQLETIQGSAGSADKELEILQKSWEFKLNQMQNTWTEFVSHLLDTDLIKAGLDTATEAISTLDGVVQNLSSSLSLLSSAFELPITVIAVLTEVVSKLNNVLSKMPDWVGKISKITSSGIPIIGNVTNGIRELAQVNSALKEILPLLTEDEEDQANALDTITEAGAKAMEALNGITDSANDSADAFQNQADSIDSLLGKLDELKKSMGEEHGSAYGDLAKDFNDALEDYENGLIGSKKVKYAVDAILSDETKESLGNDLQAEIDYVFSQHPITLNGQHFNLDFSSIFSDNGEDFGAILASQLHDIADESGNVYAEIDGANKKIMEFQDNADGTFTATYSSIQDLAQAFGTTEEFIAAWTDALDIFGADENKGWEEAATSIEEAGNKIEDAGQKAATAEGGFRQAESALKSVTEAANEAAGDIQEVADAANNISTEPIVIEVDTSKAAEAIQELLDLLNDIKPAEIEVDGEAALSQLTQLDQLLHKMSLDYEATVSVNDQASGVLGGILAQINAIEGTHTCTIKIKVDGAVPSLGGFGFAEGTDDAQGGLTLVNEKGAELISQNGRAFIAGGGKPTLVNLEPHAIVLTAEETKKALSGGGGATMMFDAALQGIPYNPTGGSKTGTGSKKPSKISSSKGTSSSDSALDTASKDLDTQLKLIDAQIKLAKNQGDMERVLQLQERAETLIIDLINNYLASGKSEDSQEVVDLMNKGYNYFNASQDLGDDFWKDFVDSIKDAKKSLDDANKLEEKRQAVADAEEALANAQNQRTVRIYNKATGQWEWVADEGNVTSAKEDLEKAKQSYQDALFDAELERLKESGGENLEEILLGSAIASVIGASSAEVQQIIATALGLVSGTASYMGQNATNAGTFPSDSHDTVYQFGNITLTQEQAETTTIAQLAKQLRALNLTNG